MNETTTHIEPPADDEAADFYRGYIEEIANEEILPFLERQLGTIEALPAAVGRDRETYRYADGKWSIRQVVGHLCDAERVFGYRAFCISRGDRTPLPGFDENEYVVRSSSETRSLDSLVAELAALRRSNLLLFRNLPAGSALNRGTANDATVSVRALAFILAGHAAHHLRILAERYGVS